MKKTWCFMDEKNANYIHANRYPVAAAQNTPQHRSAGFGYFVGLKSGQFHAEEQLLSCKWSNVAGPGKLLSCRYAPLAESMQSALPRAEVPLAQYSFPCS